MTHSHRHPPPAAGDGACEAPAAGTFREPGGAFADRIFEYRGTTTRKLVWVMAVTAVTMAVEIVGGLLTGSLALISDAGHMFTHAFAIVVSLLAIVIARNPPCHHRTYGLFRAEILAAFVNSIFLFGVTAWILWESVRRLAHPVPILGSQMLYVAVFGLAVNLVTMLILREHDHHDLNVRGVWLHLLADTLSSVAIVAGAVIIRYTGILAVDPAVSLVITLAIGIWAWGLCRESSRILLEMAPRGFDIERLSEEIKQSFPEVERLSSVHFWAITSEMYVFTAHVKVRGAAGEKELIGRLNRYLKERYPIVESTIQLAH